MKVNNKEIKGNEFAYDGCHKIYIIEDLEDKVNAIELEYDILPITELKNTFINSCDLRFINNWKLNTIYVAQFEKAIFN